MLLYSGTGLMGLPDRPSEAVFQRRGANIKDLDFGKPGVDASHLLKDKSNLNVNRMQTLHMNI